MSRIVSVWLQDWPIARLLLAQASAAPADALDPCRPLVLVAPGKGGPRLVTLNRAARQSGLVAGDLLSNARSKVLDLQVRAADPAADAAALDRLALWAMRYAPLAAPWDEASGADGLFIDVTGAAHLFGGEAALLADLDRRLRAFGLAPRLAVAGTPGAAWALARYGRQSAVGSRQSEEKAGARLPIADCRLPHSILAPGAEAEALRPLPLAALRLPEATLSLSWRLGLRRIGEVIHQPRAPVAARLEALLNRLDQALGLAPEPLVPAVPPPVYRVQAAFTEPIVSHEHVLEAATRLLTSLVADLASDGVGARVLRLMLFRVMPKACLQDDGQVQSVEIGLAAPSRDPRHIVRLIALRLDRVADGLEADFGFEAAALHVLVAEPLADRQTGFRMDEAAPPPEALAQLIDRLQQRLGRAAVRQLHPRQSHIPERAEETRSPSPRASPTSPHAPTARGEGRGEGQGHTPRSESLAAPHPNPLPASGERGSAQRALPWITDMPRPLLLLPRPEPAEVVALIPEGPPRQFRWRGVRHQVAHAQGPERIAPEWWRQSDGEAAERDYYTVEDSAGRRFWLYRAGLYGQGETPPQWFIHGVFG
jgi:protein ImuB